MTTIAVSFNDNAIHVFSKETVAENRFSDFTIRDKLGGSVIALAPQKKQLMYVTKAPQNACSIIDLNNLNGCSLTKEYNSIKAGDLRKNKLQKFLKNIFLNFHSGSGPVTLSVYNAQNDLPADIKLLESKAKKWQDIVSKFLKDKARMKEI